MVSPSGKWLEQIHRRGRLCVFGEAVLEILEGKAAWNADVLYAMAAIADKLELDPEDSKEEPVENHLEGMLRYCTGPPISFDQQPPWGKRRIQLMQFGDDALAILGREAV